MYALHMNAIPHVLAALATYRLARMVAVEDGPGAVFAKWRAQMTARNAGRAWVVTGVKCPMCLSFWIAPAMWLLAWHGGPAGLAAVACLAYSGVATWLWAMEPAE